VPRVVIDGYNLLFRERDPGEASLEELRAEFLRRVDAARPAGTDVVVVFDGRPGTAGSGPGAAPGLRVRFAASPRSADDLIVSLVRASGRGSTTVLTRDRELARRVKAAGAGVGDPDAFFRRPAHRSGPSRPAEKPPPPEGAELEEWERLFDEGDPDG
jgi:predicted RNA-binding protein with PIN domain